MKLTLPLLDITAGRNGELKWSRPAMDLLEEEVNTSPLFYLILLSLLDNLDSGHGDNFLGSNMMILINNVNAVTAQFGHQHLGKVVKHIILSLIHI